MFVYTLNIIFCLIYCRPDFVNYIYLHITYNIHISNIRCLSLSPLDVAASISADALETKLEMLDGMGDMKVTRDGDCAGYTWTVEWTTLGGDHPQLDVRP